MLVRTHNDPHKNGVEPLGSENSLKYDKPTTKATAKHEAADVKMQVDPRQVTINSKAPHGYRQGHICPYEEQITTTLRIFYQKLNIITGVNGTKDHDDGLSLESGFVHDLCQNDVPKMKKSLDRIRAAVPDFPQSVCATWYKNNVRYYFKYYSILCHNDHAAITNYIKCKQSTTASIEAVSEKCKDPVSAEYIYAHVLNYKIGLSDNTSAQNLTTTLIACSTRSYIECEKKIHNTLCDPYVADFGYTFSSHLNSELFIPHWKTTQQCADLVPDLYQDLYPVVQQFNTDSIKIDPKQSSCDNYNLLTSALKITAHHLLPKVPTARPTKQSRSDIATVFCKFIGKAVNSWRPILNACPSQKSVWIGNALHLLQDGCFLWTSSTYKVNCNVLNHWYDMTPSGICMDIQWQVWRALYFLNVQIYDPDLFSLSVSSQYVGLLDMLVKNHTKCAQHQLQSVLEALPSECGADIAASLRNSMDLLLQLERNLIEVLQTLGDVLNKDRLLIKKENNVIPFSVELIFNIVWHMAHFV